ncbi:hypothetical protein ACLOJK_005989 [Asimina triloba]
MEQERPIAENRREMESVRCRERVDGGSEREQEAPDRQRRGRLMEKERSIAENGGEMESAHDAERKWMGGANTSGRGHFENGREMEWTPFPPVTSGGRLPWHEGPIS